MAGNILLFFVGRAYNLDTNTKIMEKNEIIKKGFYDEIKPQWIQQSGLDAGIFAKEVSFCIQHIHNNPYLENCSQTSFLKAVLNIAQCGLTLNPIAKEAYLVPRKINNSLECVLDPSYMGLNKLLTDSGAVTHSSAVLIWEGDEIEVNMADTKDPIKKHVPYFLTSSDQGEIKGVYDVATLPDGDKHTEFMSKKDIDEIMEYSETVKAIRKAENKKETSKAEGLKKWCPWFKDYGEMARKTVSKRHWKRLPKSKVKAEKFNNAIQFSNLASGYDEPIGIEMLAYIETLMKKVGCDDEGHRYKMDNLETRQQGNEFIKQLKERQLPQKYQNPKTAKDVDESIEQQIEMEEFKEREK